MVLLAWPVWFALAGPAHLSGLVWPNISKLGGFLPSSFVTPAYPSRSIIFLALGGYAGAPLASAAYLGWGFLAVLAAGVLAFRRDRRLWFFGFAFVLCLACSLLARPGQWEPARVLSRIPVIENVIEQRFMAFGFLAAAVMLAIILDRAYRAAPDWRGVLGALAATGVALAPMTVIFGERLPFAMQPVTLPRWYSEVGPGAALRAGAALVPRAVLGDPVRHGLAGGEPHALQPGGRRGASGRGEPGGLGGRGVHGVDRARLRRRRARADGDAGPARRRPPRARRCGGSTRW